MHRWVVDGLEVHPERLHDRFRLGQLESLVVVLDPEEQMAHAFLGDELEASVERVAIILERDTK